MKQLIFLGIFFCAVTNINGQSKKETILSDTSFALALISKDCSTQRYTLPYGMVDDDLKLKKKEVIVIKGVYNYVKPNTKDTTWFYEIHYKKNSYYVDTANVITDKTYFNQIRDMSKEHLVNFQKNAEIMGEAIYLQKVDNAKQFVRNTSKQGLTILKWLILDDSEYTNGTSVEVTVYNPSKKVIKYIWFTFQGFNAVNDIIIDSRRKASSITMQGIGPIDPETTTAYKFEYVWFSDLVNTAIISKVKIQYMDGTFKSIVNPKSIIVSDDDYQLLFEEDIIFKK